MTTKLKPCPFCGDKPMLSKCPVAQDVFYYVVVCNNIMCNVRVATVSFFTEQEAIEAWNTRKGEENG